jgi:glycosyltransferase involved in cell wall biosynthesis
VRLFNPQAKIALHMNCEWLTQLDPKVIAGRLEQVDLVLGASEYIADKIKEGFPKYAGVLSVSYCGVDPRVVKGDKYTPTSQRTKPAVLLFVGRVSPEKGVHVLLGAMQRVVRSCPDVKLRIVGGISSAPLEFMIALNDDPKMKALAQFYGPDSPGESYYHKCLKGMINDDIREKIEFLGSKPYHELAEYYQECDMCITPSFTEAGATSLIEAMSFGNAIVASAVGGINNVVVDGVTGLLVESGDEVAMAHAIISLLEDPARRVQMGSAGRQRVLEKFSFERIAERLLGDYKRVVAN